LHESLTSVDQNILRLIRVSLKKERSTTCVSLASSTLSHPFLCFVSTALVPGQCKPTYIAGGGDPGVGVAAAVEATCITMVHAAATAVQEATAVRESVDLRVKDVEDQAALAEREALERVSRVEAENAVALVSAREDAEGFV
jgi:hypothetical protein